MSQPTEPLYHFDPYLKEFEASILEVRDVKDGSGLVLERSAFYPGGGGQPQDHGTINGIRVLSVVEEGKRIVHSVGARFRTGESVKGVLDWDRRFDLMQQHSGQHLLSQAFVHELDSGTISFHLGCEKATIDLDIPDLSDENARKVENEANRIVFENRDILVYEKSIGQLDDVPLRKRPDLSVETARIVEISGYDWSLCCGTHVRRTGEIGMIQINGWEKYKGGVRLEFCSGFRALRNFQSKNGLVRLLEKTLTAGESEIADRVMRLKDDYRAVEKKHRALLDRLLIRESENILQTAKTVGTVRMVSAFLGQRDFREAQELTRKLVSSDSVAAIVGAVQGGSGTVFFARSDKLDLDLRPALQAALESVNAKGGGSQRWAQCSIAEAEKIELAMKNAIKVVEKTLSGK
jgi:alanyl-tRNA synthetase